MVLQLLDLLLAPLYLLVIWMIATKIRNKKERLNPAYSYFTKGLFVKIGGAMALVFIYQFYYTGGDTTNYFEAALSLENLMKKDPAVFLDIWLRDQRTPENLSVFDSHTGYPVYWHDTHSYFVVRMLVPFCLLGMNSFVPVSILMAVFSFSGVWALYLLFYSRFPVLKKQLAIAILFIPSVVFWGSGVLKDSITLSAIGWYVYCFYQFFIAKEYRVKWLLILISASFLLIAIKPYILFALLPGSVIWLTNEWLSRFENKTIRMIAGPFLLAFAVSGGYLILQNLESQLGLYTLDNVLDRAVTVQRDLKQDYYGGNTFDIGDFEANIPSIIGKLPEAVFAALFRPSLLDVRNPVMLLSALENAFILWMTFILLIRLKIFGFFTLIWKHPLLLFSMLFALFFAFSVGLSISNFGSLVRLKIPSIPFYVASLFVLKYFLDRKITSRMVMSKPFVKDDKNPQPVI